MLWGSWGERKRQRAGHDGKGNERREAPAFFLFPSSSARFLFFRLLLFLYGYPTGASAEERVLVQFALIFQERRGKGGGLLRFRP